MIVDTYELIDEFLRLKAPGRYEMTETDRAYLQEELRKRIGGTSQEHIDRSVAALREMKITYLSGFIKPGAPFTAEDVLDFTEQKRDRKNGGRVITGAVREAAKVAIEAFAEVDSKAGTHAEAMELAMKRTANLRPQVAERSVRRWLTEILPFSDIQKPKRGRPPKKQE